MRMLQGTVGDVRKHDEEVEERLQGVADEFLFGWLEDRGVNPINRHQAIKKIIADFGEKVGEIAAAWAEVAPAVEADTQIPSPAPHASGPEPGSQEPEPPPAPAVRPAPVAGAGRPSPAPAVRTAQRRSGDRLRDAALLTEPQSVVRRPFSEGGEEEIQEIAQLFAAACVRERGRFASQPGETTNHVYMLDPEVAEKIRDFGVVTGLGHMRLLRAAVDTLIAAVGRGLPVYQRALPSATPWLPDVPLVGRGAHAGQVRLHCHLYPDTQDAIRRLCRISAAFPSDVVGWAADQAVLVAGWMQRRAGQTAQEKTTQGSPTSDK